MSVFLFVFGIIVGSFLNVLVLRMHAGTSFMTGRSHCVRCKNPLAWYDNVPLLSFLFLHGRCRHCAKKISWQYPFVEFGTGLLFVFFGSVLPAVFSFEAALVMLTALFVIASFVVLFVYDVKYMEMPVAVLWSAIGGGVASVVLHSVWPEQGSLLFASPSVWSSIFSGAGAFAFFFAMSAYSREQWMGAGDAYVALSIGLLLGWPGIFFALVLAFTLGALVGIALIILRRGTGKTQLPFAPFLLAGFFIASLFLWYFPGMFFLFV